MSTQNTPERFSILKNGVDERLEIIRDNESGFYNITKTAKMIAKLLETNENLENNKPAGIPRDSSKCQNPSDWFTNNATKELIGKCKELTGLDKVYYMLKKDTKMQYRGIYIHELLYNHFLTWLDPSYGMLVSIVLKQIHQDANRKLLQEKDDAIGRLENKIDLQSEESKARDEAQAAEIQKLLSYAQNTTHELSEARLDIQDNTTQIELLNDKVEECRDVIIDRMEEN